LKKVSIRAQDVTYFFSCSDRSSELFIVDRVTDSFMAAIAANSGTGFLNFLFEIKRKFSKTDSSFMIGHLIVRSDPRFWIHNESLPNPGFQLK
jgi:hypothetical protein